MTSGGASASRSGATGTGVTGTSANAAAQKTGTTTSGGASDVVVSGGLGAALAGALAAFLA